MEDKYKLAVGLDFDGVIHSYTSGWQGEDIISDPPVKGVKWAIGQLRRTAGYKVIVWSTRCKTKHGREAIRKWLIKWEIEVDDIVLYKPVCSCYVDDRAVTFNGDWAQTIIDIMSFRNYIECKEKKNESKINGEKT